MLADCPAQDEDAARLSPGGKTLVAVLIFYTTCIAIATYPVVLTLRSAMPGGLADPIQHLWLMRWYKTCLLEGRSPFLCPDIQYPLGAPLGNFSPTNLQSLLYLIVSVFIKNDILCFNIIWFLGFLSTGMGTFLLAWYVVRDRASACLGGLLAMCSSPMINHGCGGHLELIYLGGFPLFLIAWLRLVDRPGKGRLFAAVLLFILVVMSSPYFVILTVFPAALYVVMQAVQAGRSWEWSWFRSRALWLAAFVALTVPCLLVLFSGQLWNLAHGHSMLRRRMDFNLMGAPLWSYFLPTIRHLLGQVLPLDLHAATNINGEQFSYLGVVTIALISYAAVHRVQFPRRAYWWFAFLMLVVLSLGAYWRIGWRFGPYRVGLPASWLWKYFFAFRLIRVPARFNLFAAIGAAVLGAAGLRHLLARVANRRLRAAVCGGLVVVAFADLAIFPIATFSIPTMPACYDFLRRRHPEATFLEVPFYGRSGNACSLTALCGYWQSLHRGKTTGCYTAHFNIAFDNLLIEASPFTAWSLANPDNLKNPEAETFGLVRDVRFTDYVWLYLTAHKLDYIILHTSPSWEPGLTLHLDRLKSLLRDAKVFEDESTVIYDRALLKPPARPTILCAEGWRLVFGYRGRLSRGLSKTGSLVVYNPSPEQDFVLALEALSSSRAPRSVRIRAQGVELARWQYRHGQYQTCMSPPFRLPAGLQTITIESDAEEPPSRREAEHELDMRPLSLRVTAVSLTPVPPSKDPSLQVTQRLGGDDRHRGVSNRPR